VNNLHSITLYKLHT